MSGMTTIPQFQYRKTIVSPHVDGLMAMDEDGQISVHPTPDALIKALQKRDKATARKGASTATLIEWRDMPEGFQPPEIDS